MSGAGGGGGGRAGGAGGGNPTIPASASASASAPSPAHLPQQQPQQQHPHASPQTRMARAAVVPAAVAGSPPQQPPPPLPQLQQRRHLPQEQQQQHQPARPFLTHREREALHPRPVSPEFNARFASAFASVAASFPGRTFTAVAFRKNEDPPDAPDRTLALPTFQSPRGEYDRVAAGTSPGGGRGQPSPGVSAEFGHERTLPVVRNLEAEVQTPPVPKRRRASAPQMSTGVGSSGGAPSPGPGPGFWGHVLPGSGESEGRASGVVTPGGTRPGGSATGALPRRGSSGAHEIFARAAESARGRMQGSHPQLYASERGVEPSSSGGAGGRAGDPTSAAGIAAGASIGATATVPAPTATGGPGPSSLPAFECQFCVSRFRRKSDRNRHVRVVHQKLRPFVCNICNSAFGEKSNRNKHIRMVHQNIRTFKCPHCTATFGQRGNCEAHVRAVHEKNKSPRYTCRLCGDAFARKAQLNEHRCPGQQQPQQLDPHQPQQQHPAIAATGAPPSALAPHPQVQPWTPPAPTSLLQPQHYPDQRQHRGETNVQSTLPPPHAIVPPSQQTPTAHTPPHLQHYALPRPYSSTPTFQRYATPESSPSTQLPSRHSEPGSHAPSSLRPLQPPPQAQPPGQTYDSRFAQPHLPPLPRHPPTSHQPQPPTHQPPTHPSHPQPQQQPRGQGALAALADAATDGGSVASADRTPVLPQQPHRGASYQMPRPALPSLTRQPLMQHGPSSTEQQVQQHPPMPPFHLPPPPGARHLAPTHEHAQQEGAAPSHSRSQSHSHSHSSGRLGQPPGRRPPDEP